MPFWTKDTIPLPEEDLDTLHSEILNRFRQLPSNLTTTIEIVETYYKNVFNPNYQPLDHWGSDGILFKQRLYDTLAAHLTLTCAQQIGEVSASQLSKLEDIKSSSEYKYYDFVNLHFSQPWWNPKNFRPTLEAAKIWVSLLTIHGESGLKIEGHKNIQFNQLILDLEHYLETGRLSSMQEVLGDKLDMHPIDWAHIRASQTHK